MMEGNPGFAIERELHVKKVKRVLDNWREITLVMNSVLLWKKQLYPWVIVAITSFIFMEFAYYSPSFLTSIGLLCLCATLIDYAGPTVSSMIWRHDDWNAAKEREFEEICRALASCLVYVKQYWAYVMEVKATRPYMYFLGTISSSVFLALIGNSVNNIFVLYLLCLYALMLPGMLHYGILQKYYNIALAHLLSALRSVNSTVQTKSKVQ